MFLFRRVSPCSNYPNYPWEDSHFIGIFYVIVISDDVRVV